MQFTKAPRQKAHLHTSVVIVIEAILATTAIVAVAVGNFSPSVLQHYLPYLMLIWIVSIVGLYFARLRLAKANLRQWAADNGYSSIEITRTFDDSPFGNSTSNMQFVFQVKYCSVRGDGLAWVKVGHPFYGLSVSDAVELKQQL